MPWFRTDDERVADELETARGEILRLRRQLEAHAELAPYPQVAERLLELQRAEEANARVLAERLIALGRPAPVDRLGPVRGGRNAWERMAVTLEDYRSLLRRLTQLWVRWDDEHPEDAALVRRVLDSATADRDAVVDLLARSDPHAID